MGAALTWVFSSRCRQPIAIDEVLKLFNESIHVNLQTSTIKNKVYKFIIECLKGADEDVLMYNSLVKSPGPAAFWAVIRMMYSVLGFKSVTTNGLSATKKYSFELNFILILFCRIPNFEALCINPNYVFIIINQVFGEILVKRL